MQEMVFCCRLLVRGTRIVQEIYFHPQIDEIKVFISIIKKYFGFSMCKIENIEKTNVIKIIKFENRLKENGITEEDEPITRSQQLFR